MIGNKTISTRPKKTQPHHLLRYQISRNPVTKTRYEQKPISQILRNRIKSKSVRLNCNQRLSQLLHSTPGTSITEKENKSQTLHLNKTQIQKKKKKNQLPKPDKNQNPSPKFPRIPEKTLHFIPEFRPTAKLKLPPKTPINETRGGGNGNALTRP